MDLELSGKRALVTGSTAGIGAAIVQMALQAPPELLGISTNMSATQLPGTMSKEIKIVGSPTED